MFTVTYAMVKHDDVAKFDLEDGLVREAAQSLLETPSTTEQIRIDLPREDEVPLGLAHRDPALDALVTIAAGSEEDARPANLADLVGDVARVAGAWSVQSLTIAEREDSWIGSATRGITVHLLCNRGAGIDQTSYDAWRRDALKTCADTLDGVGVREYTVDAVLVEGDGFDTHVEFSFPTEAELDEALAANVLSSVVDSELLEESSVRLFTATQQLLAPNENAWEMHLSSDEGGEG